ncbi:MAG: hypothetical protein LBJ35_02735 [Spirochaetaceae bacterium]|nr:hypothetical protein [Spirochaetaceae bacterium]
MKKSFIGFSAALVLLLALVGCEQATDSDSGGGSTPPLPGLVSDLSTIAASFDDGIDVVRVGNNLYLNSEELVIPAGKTLDLATNNVDLGGLSENSKLIAEGDILLNYSQNVPGGIQWSGLKDTAKIIASESFITKYVNVDYTGITDIDTAWTKLTAGASGVIKAKAEQIIVIQDFADFMSWNKTLPPDPEAKQGYLFDNGYLALRTPKEGGIRAPEAAELEEKASGIKLYLIGSPIIIDVSSTGGGEVGINLTGSANLNYYKPKTWPPRATTPDPVPPEASILFNYGGDTDGSLTAAGSVDLKNGSVNSPAGFNVWGVLKNTGAQQDALSVTAQDTPFTGLTVRLHGVTFGGKTAIKGSVRNSFGASATFSDDLTLGGPATFNGATFSGETVFSGPVIFTAPGTEGQTPVVFKKGVTFSNDVIFKGPANFEAPLENNMYFGRLETSDLNIISSLKAVGESASAELPQDVINNIATFTGNIKFLADEITIGTESAITFEKLNAAGIMRFPNAESVTVKDAAANIGGAVFGEATTASFGAGLTVSKDVAFGSYAAVYGNLVVGGNATFSGGGSLTSEVTITGNLSVDGADDKTFVGKSVNIGGDLNLNVYEGGLITLDVPAEVKGEVIFGTEATLGLKKSAIKLGPTTFYEGVNIGSAAIVFDSVSLIGAGTLGSGGGANITVLGNAKFNEEARLQGKLIFGNAEGVTINTGTISKGFDVTANGNILTVKDAAVSPDTNVVLKNASIVFGANGGFNFLGAGGSTSIKLAGPENASVVATNTITIGGTAVTGKGAAGERAVLDANGDVILTIGDPNGPSQSMLRLNTVDLKLTKGAVAFGPGATAAEAGSLVLIDTSSSGNIITAAETNNSTGMGLLVGGTAANVGYGIITGSLGMTTDDELFGSLGVGTVGAGYLLTQDAAFIKVGTLGAFGSEAAVYTLDAYSADKNPVAVFTAWE